MRPPLKLSSIDQEHLQELYNEAGIARDELPYTPPYDGLCQGFQDRTFKNAHPEQVYSALLKYVRSGTNSAGCAQRLFSPKNKRNYSRASFPATPRGAS